MKLYIKQKVFSWRDRFSVKDEFENDRYFVEGEITLSHKKLHIYNASGAKVAFVRQAATMLKPRFLIEMYGHVVCEIVKELTFFQQSYRLQGLPWHLHGDFLAHEYSLVENNWQIMQLSKKWFSWGASYEMNIAVPQNELICLCIALAVECVLAQQRKQHRNQQQQLNMQQQLNQQSAQQNFHHF